jgi:FkbM family methyltransferase
MKDKIQNIFRFLGFEFSRFPRKVILSKRDAHFKQLLKEFKIDLILDVGAANGGYVEWVRSLGCNKRVISFEPLQVSFAELMKKVNQDALWEAANFALGETEENSMIHVAGNLDSSSLLPMLETHEKAAPHAKVTRQETIQKIRLDNFDNAWINEAKSVFLKMDVQGYEKQVLVGAENLLNRITGLQIEMSLVPLYAGQILFEEQLQRCKNLGYELYYVRTGLADPATGRLLQLDGIFFKPSR